jgi:adenine phosphoribosyltransferase
MNDTRINGLRGLIRDVPDFPEPGVVFKDITPVLADAAALNGAVEALAGPYLDSGITRVVGIEARGFIFGVPVARRLGVGFVPIRKPGKLPYSVEREEYTLEYGTDLLEIHTDALVPGDRVLIIDDVLATGGTAAAAVRLIRRLGAEVSGVAVLVELSFLDGRSHVPDGVALTTLVTYDAP